MVSLLERYEACMVLHSVGDCIGYKNSQWEFNSSGLNIHQEMNALGGIDKLVLDRCDWRASDDTILHLAVAECLIETKDYNSPSDVYMNLIKHYKTGMNDMDKRAPGGTTINSVSHLNPNKINGYKIAFNERGGGCGASMRSSCIGLRYSKPEQLNDLIQFSIESGRMTHHCPMGYLGGTVAALMVSYAIQEIPIKSWGNFCLRDLKQAYDYVLNSDHFPQENIKSWYNFTQPFQAYLKLRNIENGITEPSFPLNYGVKERDDAYRSFGNKFFAGACGVDSVIIAYDSLLGCGNDWRELCSRSMLHGGDSDSTGCIAASFYGAINGFNGVNQNNYKDTPP